MTTSNREWKCPNGCDTATHDYPPPYPFFAPACCLGNSAGQQAELGIYVSGKALTDFWTDGTRGTEGWEWDDCLPHCSVCLEEAVWK